MPRITALSVALFLLAGSRAQAVSDWQSMAPDGRGNWSEAANWNPAVVPNNDAGNLYDVTIRQLDPDIDYSGPTLDILVTIENLTLVDRAAVRTDPDNSVRLTVNGTTSLTTSPGNDGAYGLLEVNSGSVFSLHQLANLNNGVLTGGYAITAGANGAVLEFDNADVTNNQAYLSLSGAMADFRERESGLQAPRNLSMNGGVLLLDNGRKLELNGPLTNAGFLQLDSSSSSATTRLIVNGNLANTPGAVLRINGQISFTELINQGSNDISVAGGEVQFFGSASAGQNRVLTFGSPTNVQGAVTGLGETSTAGSATFITYGGKTRGLTALFDNATGGNAQFTVYGSAASGDIGGMMSVGGNATAGNATITLNGGTVSGNGSGGMLDFLLNASAGNATLIAHGGQNGGEGGFIRFFHDSSGGTASVQLDGNSELSIGNHNGGVTIGSLEGSGGDVNLDLQNLTIGSNGRSTSFAGRIQSTGGGLIKIGVGTLALSHANTYAGGTTINGGLLLANNPTDSATGPGAVVVNNSGSVLGGSGLVDGAVTINQSAALRGGEGMAAEGSLTLRAAVTLNDGAIIELVLGVSGAHSSLVRSGTSVWSFDTDQAFRFISLGAQPGSYDNLITGLAGNAVDPSQWKITNAGWMGTFSFDGDNIDLDLVAVPEPGGWIVASLALGLMAWKQRHFATRRSLLRLRG